MNENDDEDGRYEEEEEEEESNDESERSPSKSINHEEENKAIIPSNKASHSLGKSSLSIDVGDSYVTEFSPPTNFSIYPSLRGTLFRENNLIKCVGEWAMTDSAHGIPGQTSEFEFKLTSQNVSDFPISGKYVGWFHLKQPMKPPLKVEDKELNIVFKKSEDEEDRYEINGSGMNKFGKFSLYGTFKLSGGKLQMYRVYLPKKSATQTPKSVASQTPKSAKGPKTPTFASPRSGRTPSSGPVAPSPREIGQRVRKPSAVLSGTFETPSTPTLTPKRQQYHEVSESFQPPQPLSLAPQASSSSGRHPRAPSFLLKCKDILKDLSKQPLSIYFNDPVDPIKLNIPDYFTIIKEPMDFNSIRANLEENFYSSHEQFAEHMRLVFRNAIAYNVRRDNPVHIAARELSDVFEERYRVMVSQLSATYTVSYDESLLPPMKKSVGRARGSKGSNSRLSGPRDFALDGSAQAMRMMQQKMLEMEAEINSLRTAVRQSDIRATLEHQMVAAQVPLSLEEKKLLTSNIQKLNGDQMAGLVDIIQHALPSACSDSEELEIPVDDLDTYTLRQIQDFIQNALTANSKKRMIPPSPSGRGAGAASRQNPPKKPRTTTPATPTRIATAPSPLPFPAPQPSSLLTTTPSQPSLDSTVPTFFSNQSYVPPPPAEATTTAEASTGGRKRSNSLDFFPADESNNIASESSLENFDAWKRVAEQSNGETLSGGGRGDGWGDALYEKHVSDSRKITLQAEAEKSKELRSKLEEERTVALALERQRSLIRSSDSSSNNNPSGGVDDSEIQRRTKELEFLREQERLSREELEPTVELSNAHSALYHNTLYEL